ncbi:DUF2264 domain-containing protein [Paenibacillus turicensis]|uniref:DUF2264 domain-containing protein n=1 Tax=Paenibacillus turicensis TaxID=160487 RepID=UPI003D265B28
MSNYLAELKNNPLVDKQDIMKAVTQLITPLQPYYSAGKARLELGVTGVGYGSNIAGIEGFSRVMWGLVPFLAGGADINHPLWETTLQGIINGTNPRHEEYFGEVGDYDQRLVEMAVFGFALALIPEAIWEPLTQEQQQNLYHWLNQINSHPCYDCNWLFFNVLVNIGFSKRGLPYDQSQLHRNLERLDDFYLGDGWYSDGPEGHSDYYVPFAIQYYALLYVKLMGEEDPERTERWKARAAEFSQQFIAWFTPQGEALPYGRSLSYRFSQSAFWSALAFAEVEVLPWGVVKGIVLRNLRWWFQQPIFDHQGILTVGYRYPNLVMAENYNSPGSPYWALKTFLIAALPASHPFWQAEELPLPPSQPYVVQQQPHLVICSDLDTGHVVAFNSGHHATNEHTHTSAKYEKFVYSTAFGFSVPRGEWGLAQGAYDGMLALSEQGERLYRVRRKNEQSMIKDNVLFSKWQPWRNVEIQTWVIAGLPWHIRIHRIENERSLDVAEGGYAFPIEQPFEITNIEGGKGKKWLKVNKGDKGIKGAIAQCLAVPLLSHLHEEDIHMLVVSSASGSSGVLNLLGYDSTELVHAQANTNLLHPRTVIPTLTATLEPGIHWFASAIVGDSRNFSQSEDIWSSCKQLNELNVIINDKHITIKTHEGEQYTIEL